MVEDKKKPKTLSFPLGPITMVAVCQLCFVEDAPVHMRCIL